jgi:hypothetical protein
VTGDFEAIETERAKVAAEEEEEKFLASLPKE